MFRIHFNYFLFLYILLEACPSLGTNITATTFTGLQGDYNFGHSGYVYMQSDAIIPELKLSSCQYYDVNQTTCNFVDESPRLDSSVMVLRAWTALTLRDNILALLGYLMHQPNKTFYEDNLSTLRLLYEEIRRNNMKTMDLLPRMKSMTKPSKVSQVLALFKMLPNVVPPFCRSAIVELSRIFSKRRNLLKNILGANKGVDLFADIGLQMVPLLRFKTAKKYYDKAVEFVMGKEFAIMFAAIQEGRIVLTQPVLAVMMLNMKFSDLPIESTEDFRFLTDILRLNKIPDWSPGFSGSCCINFKDPYDMVHTMMKTVTERAKVDPIIRRTVLKLLPRLVRATKSSASKTMDTFFGNSNFDISLLLDILTKEVKIPEANAFRSMVQSGSINLAYALKGFVRYFYDTPKKLVLAFIQRARFRIPISNEAKNHLDAILFNLQGGNLSDISEDTNVM